jgi:hypothetical protein
MSMVSAIFHPPGEHILRVIIRRGCWKSPQDLSEQVLFASLPSYHQPINPGKCIYVTRIDEELRCAPGAAMQHW